MTDPAEIGVPLGTYPDDHFDVPAPPSNDWTYIMVLNDGETYTNLKGCAIMRLPENVEPDDIEEWLDEVHGGHTEDTVYVFGDTPPNVDMSDNLNGWAES